MVGTACPGGFDTFRPHAGRFVANPRNEASGRGRGSSFGNLAPTEDSRTLPGWSSIPGARGGTSETCGFRDCHERFADLGVRVVALSTQGTGYQRELAERLELPFEVLSDVDLRLVHALRLPTSRRTAGRS